jgi:hypothetical protein
MANMEVEEVLDEEVHVENEGDDVVEVTPEGKKKKGIVKIEKKTKIQKPNKHVED